MRTFRWPLGLVLAVVLVGCGGNGEDSATDEGLDPGAQETTDETEDATEETEEATDETDSAGAIGVSGTDLGDILVDADGRTLYVFDQDSDGESACYDDCAANWPPLLGPVEAAAGADEVLIGTTERTDGGTQVTYDGNPLYYFAADADAGDLNGQGVGDVWWVVSPEGDKITDSAAGAPAREY